MKEFYTIKELSEKFKVSTKTIERHVKSLVRKDKNRVLIPLDIVEVLKLRHEYNSELSGADVFDVVEGFSSEEYQEFQKRLIEYPILKEQIEYHKKSAESHQRQMEKLLSLFEQRNILEASKELKEKNDNN